MHVSSIHSPKTVLPLFITEEVMRKILTRYNVNPEFLHILFSLGNAPHISKGGSSYAMYSRSSDNTQNTFHFLPSVDKYLNLLSGTCCYQLQYAEENQRSKHSPWSFRHTAVYHHHDSTTNFDLFILLHPVENSYLEQQLINLTLPGTES